MYNPFSLDGKTILVTGASSGIGKATAIECSKMGAKIIACGRNIERLQETICQLEGSQHKSFAGDFTEENIIEELLNKIPLIDGAVLAAGQTLVLPLTYSTPQKFEDIFKLNFFSTIELLRLLAKRKKMNSNASVVIITAAGGVKSFVSGHCVYGTSKAALDAAMRYAALEFAPRKIRVNSICPGLTETPMIHEGNVSDDQLLLAQKMNPLKRNGSPRDIAMGAAYLLSDAASWITGQSLVIDGGASI